MKCRIPFILFVILCCAFSASANEAKVRLGIDVLLDENADLLAGKRIALLTNFTGRLSDGRLTAEVFSKRSDFKLVKIFTPEHGFYLSSPAGKSVDNTTIYGVPTISLYGGNRHPTAEQLSDCDIVVVDLQDVGVRSYTYASTVLYVAESALKAGKFLIVCDRPNPLGGLAVDGNVLEPKYKSFIGLLPVPYLHGCTIGELVMMAIGEGWLDVQKNSGYEIITMDNWKRSMTWEDTGLMWFPTSPNVPTVNSVRGMAMLGAFGELSLFNIGIGTSTPFQYCGITKDLRSKTDKALENIKYDGISLTSCNYGAKSENFGYFLNFSNCDSVLYFSAGIDLALVWRDAVPEKFTMNTDSAKRAMFVKATGTEELFNAIMKKATREYIMKIARRGIDNYMITRQKYLIQKYGDGQ